MKGIENSGDWERMIPARWIKEGIGRTDIHLSILNNPALKRAIFIFETGPMVQVNAANLRRALAQTPLRSDTEYQIVGPFNIDPKRKLIDNIKVEMKVLEKINY